MNNTWDEDWERSDLYNCILGVTLVCIGLVLNHPLLQLCGWIGAIVTIVMAVVAVFDPYPWDLLLTIPLSIVISFGLASLGFYLSKYRLHMIIYSRRLWRALEATGGSRQRVQRHVQEGDSDDRLRRGLLDH
eukprot:CAMPEP_0194037272 /NCGR_PEP_ID=MMETSP0009_2-20130614/9611_1 /TAXON_ID=210454 /ORGANISM="Grammatophora oceanica, Strain CCMP 410" /LENGTH=131 /DNA_ID=CAMNT_0038679369 /DNA_START=43 /DNA_END=438 /DNA_ORIENTATION=-